MKKILLYLFLILPLFSVGQSKTNDSAFKNTVVNISLPDTLSLNNIDNNKKDSNPLEKKMPWIAALTIGILSALINFYISHKLKLSNERNLQKQIDNAKETTLTQFKATIGTKNRQDWINEVRHELSDLISNGVLMGFEKIEENPSRENISKYLEKIVYTRAKIEMLLNDQKPEQDRILKAVKLLIEENNKVTKENINSENTNAAKREIIHAARELFKIHWRKIKELR